MRKWITYLILGFLLVVGSASMKADSTNFTPRNVPEYAQSISVKISTPESHGSGVVFTRKDSTGTNLISFVWTAGHLFTPRSESVGIFFLGMTGTNAPIIDHAEIIQNVVVNGESQPAGSNILARIIKISAEHKNDIALLQLEKPFFNTNTVVFDLSTNIPIVGERLYNVSAPFGIDGTVSEGIFSFIGRKKEGYLYDQTSCVVYPGSSGGGYFLTNGVCVGLANIMRAPSINFMVPVRRLREWAKTENIEWALDPSLPIPTDAEIRAIKMKSDK
jgi:S1-C subfamily serine protease